MGRNRWLSFDGLLVSSRCMSVDCWIGVAGKVLLLNWFLRLLALVRLQPGERARFPCGEIPAAVPDGFSVPVVRSGNTGKSRFLEASLALAVPIPLQDSGASVPIDGGLFQLGFSRGQIASRRPY